MILCQKTSSKFGMLDNARQILEILEKFRKKNIGLIFYTFKLHWDPENCKISKKKLF